MRNPNEKQSKVLTVHDVVAKPSPHFTSLDEVVQNCDCALMLGQALNKDGTVPKTLEYRAIAAAGLWRMADKLGKKDFRIVLSGGDPVNTGVTEAQRCINMLKSDPYNVPEYALVGEFLSTTTLENLFYSYPLIADLYGGGENADIKPRTKVALITSEFHMSRSLYMSEAVFGDAQIVDPVKERKCGTYKNFGIDVVPVPVHSGCPLQEIHEWEYFGPAHNQFINEQSLQQRLRGELYFNRDHIVGKSGTTSALDNHILKGEIKIKPLSEERLQEAVRTAKILLEVEPELRNAEMLLRE